MHTRSDILVSTNGGIFCMDILKKALNDLYNGKININKKFPTSKEYNTLVEESSEILKKINNNLSDEGKKLLNEYIEKQAQIMSIDCEEKFIDGYKLASKLIIAGIK